MDDDDVIIHEADLSQSEHQEATVRLLNAYAMDAMGDGQPLSETARRDVISGLRELPTTLVFLAYRGSDPVGLAICFRGFSTFAARPLVNISDYFVFPEYRGLGIGRRLLGAIERHARELGCCRAHPRSAGEQSPRPARLCGRRFCAGGACPRSRWCPFSFQTSLTTVAKPNRGRRQTVPVPRRRGGVHFAAFARLEQLGERISRR